MDRAIMETPPRPAGRLWFALLGAPAAWLVQEVFQWIVNEFSCAHEGPGLLGLGAGGVRALEIGVSVAALIVGGAALWSAVIEWRGSGERGVDHIQGESRPDFLASASLMMSVVFLIAIVAMGVPSFVLSGCEAVR